MTVLLAKIRANFVPQSRDARAGVGILAAVDRIDGGLLDRLGTPKRLANAEVDGILSVRPSSNILRIPEISMAPIRSKSSQPSYLRLHLNRHSCRNRLHPSGREAAMADCNDPQVRRSSRDPCLNVPFEVLILSR